jgi:hypothetical protein
VELCCVTPSAQLSQDRHHVARKTFLDRVCPGHLGGTVDEVEISGGEIVQLRSCELRAKEPLVSVGRVLSQLRIRASARCNELFLYLGLKRCKRVIDLRSRYGA